MSTVTKLWLATLVFVSLLLVGAFFISPPSEARNIQQYRDTISDSGPGFAANHTFEFIITTNVSGGGRFEFTPPLGFTVVSRPEFGIRNVELRVNGMARVADAVSSPGVDQVEITPGTPGFIRYTLAPDATISAGDVLEFRIGNHTSNSVGPITSFSTSTGTTTSPGDVEPIINSLNLGTHKVLMEVWDGGLIADAGFVISINEKVNVPGLDTTEDVPPLRFNAAPTSTVGGTTPNVEISLETDEFARCRYALTPGVSFGAMTNTFTNTGILFHSTVVPVVPDSVRDFYVRCVDDEGNFNIDDYLIRVTVGPTPSGTPGEGGTGSGPGTGGSGTGSSTNDGSGTGSGGGTGSTAGGGGSGGGGGGGGRGNDNGDTAGGGFEADDEAYRSGDARVVISGFAYPNANIAVLVDGKVARATRANSSGVYSVTLDAIAKGAYTFGVYGEGPDKVRSSTFSTSFTVTGGRTSELSNIHVVPSIKVTPDPVNPGETLTVSGYALPNSTVTLQNGKAKMKSASESTATADSSGRWSTTLNSSNFVKGTYQIRAKAVQASGVATGFSNYTFYGVGESAQTGTLSADLNRDTKINLIDFSILLFWWNTNGGNSNPPADINRDGRVTLTDFSILLFNWTG